jgi:ectoine hydroxylase-related dioxygenase (phytanoyl-CoA dioxygenase family)
MTDLGAAHHPLTELFERPERPEDWEPYVLSGEVVAQFQEQGFVDGIRLLSEEQVEALQAELTELMLPNCPGAEHFYEYHSNESAEEGTELFHALGAWRVRPAFHDLLWSPAFCMASYQLLGGSVRLFHDQLFAKPAHHGGVVAWHQDYSYWTWTEPMAHLSAWIALDDATEENGCLHYVPGSHRWGLVQRTELAGDMESVLAQLNEEQRQDVSRSVPAIMSRGEASFHHPLMMHGSFANRSSRRRHAAVINVLADGTRSNMSQGSAPGTDGYPYIPKGEPMGGTGYPLLFDPTDDLARWLRSVPTVS